MAKDSIHVTAITADIRPGGILHSRMDTVEHDSIYARFDYREVTPPERVVRTFEWDGMPGYVIIETATFIDLGDGRTKIVIDSLFHTTEERDGFLGSGMEGGLNESYAALDRLLATMD